MLEDNKRFQAGFTCIMIGCPMLRNAIVYPFYIPNMTQIVTLYSFCFTPEDKG